MLRVAPLLAVVALACACGSENEDDEARAPRTNLEISYWSAGTERPGRSWTLQCPPGGTLPNAEAACERLDELGEEAFKPPAKEMVCAQIYGGPQVAEVRGVFDGRPVNATFNRTNGCEMERWNRHEFLFPSAA